MEEGQLQPVEDGGDVAPGAGSSAGVVGIDDGCAGVLELDGADPVRGDPGQRGDLGQGVPLQGHVTGSDVQQRAPLGEPAIGIGAVAARGVAQPQIDLAEDVGADGQLPGDHQPRGERAGLDDRVDLLVDAQAFPPAAALQLGGERTRRMCGGAATPLAQPADRGKVVLDLVVPLGYQRQRGGHHSPASVCASIASQARRYSPANQSLARCR